MRPLHRIALPAIALLILVAGCGSRTFAPLPPPLPLLSAQNPVDWWFAFKFNTANFPGCKAGAVRACQFGGQPQKYDSGFSQQFVYASSQDQTLQEGIDCLGDTLTDPLGATVDQIYNGNFNYVVWNDQFYDDPPIAGCTTFCDTPWGHSKGMLAWDNSGDGLVLQVTTPSWPAAGSKLFPRLTDGNTLGCVKDDNVLVSQQFFALRLTQPDVLIVLNALSNSSVVTDPANPQIVHNGGPADIQRRVSALGKQSTSRTAIVATLSSGVRLISKPSSLQVPPWQMVSALLGGHALRAATWWEDPGSIPSTTASTPIACWDPSLPPPGAVQIATTGKWDNQTLGLQGGLGTNFNHAKIGVSISGTDTIFADMNQDGSLSGDCSTQQNGRGGLFYILEDPKLHDAIAQLISGASAPVEAP